MGDREIDVDGWGQRDHSWGAARDWWATSWCWTAGRLEDGTRFHAVGGFAPGFDLGFGYVLDPGADTFEDVTTLTLDTTLGVEDLIEDATLRFAELELSVEPVAWSPVLLVAPDGREDRFPRALCRFRSADGRRGAGWIEFNQPPGEPAA